MVKKLHGVERLFAATSRGRALLVVLGELRSEGGAVFSSPRSSISCVLGAPTIWGDPEPVVDEGRQRVTRRIMGPKQVVEQLMYPKERTSTTWSGALEQQG